ncbi:G patch domain-containing protein 3 isoform X2 [Aplysia californica]|uniref:G patch domain-containing protein 3 isoform X2 n=1 Tax=Aplysia californica TaxID=6500 RepID=A0ABM1VXL4_APLCA|nr:G patch domain-containing protein 3 isoform X2 [Aplysia californica]
MAMATQETETSNTSGHVDEKTLESMPELRPVELMPQGNVGTPTLVFLDLIQRCLLPHSLIHKLKLKFPKTSGKLLYSNVPFEYHTPKDSDFAANTPNLESGAGVVKSFPSLTQERNVKTKCLRKSDAFGKIQAFELSESSTLLSDDCNEQTPNVINDSSIAIETSSDQSTFQDAQMDMIPHPYKAEESQNTDMDGLNTEDKSVQIEASVSNANNQSGFLAPQVPLTNRERKRKKRYENRSTRKLMAEGIEERLIAIDKIYRNDDDAEEWDRHEASEDDPSNQERNKERLYEEEIEQPWEKGGPGVVFYTDAMFWQEREGDFDEQTTDDLDVDFSAYEEQGAGDKDIKDFLKIRQETRFRNGYDSTDRFSIGIGKKIDKPSSSISSAGNEVSASQHGRGSKLVSSGAAIGAFERHTKGIGRKVMEKQGWREGQGLGSSKPGITEALRGEGQRPHDKQGLGFVAEKPVWYGVPPAKKSRGKSKQSHLITTVYDDPREADPKEPLLLRSEPTTLKHRQTHKDSFNKR